MLRLVLKRCGKGFDKFSLTAEINKKGQAFCSTFFVFYLKDSKMRNSQFYIILNILFAVLFLYRRKYNYEIFFKVCKNS